jgi:hypothetical protein
MMQVAHLKSCYSTQHRGVMATMVSHQPFVLFGRDPSVVVETLKCKDLDVDGKDGYHFMRPLEVTLLLTD